MDVCVLSVCYFHICRASVAMHVNYAIATDLCTPRKPGSPRIISVTSHAVNLEWTAPESDGGYCISSYCVMYGSPAAPTVLYSRLSVEGSATNCTITDSLYPGRTYQFAVAAVNAAGCGEFLDFSSSFTFTGETGKVTILKLLLM